MYLFIVISDILFEDFFCLKIIHIFTVKFEKMEFILAEYKYVYIYKKKNLLTTNYWIVEECE